MPAHATVYWIMANSYLRRIVALDLEEQLLNAAAAVTIAGVFLPWIGGGYLGGEIVSYSGLGFFTGTVGWAVLLLDILVIAATFIPLLGGPQLLQPRYRDLARLAAMAQVTILLLAALSVLARVTVEYTRLSLRFGIHISVFSSMVGTLYAALRYREYVRRTHQEVFHHPDDLAAAQTREPQMQAQLPLSAPPPPPPPPPLEDHRLTP